MSEPTSDIGADSDPTDERSGSQFGRIAVVVFVAALVGGATFVLMAVGQSL